MKQNIICSSSLFYAIFSTPVLEIISLYKAGIGVGIGWDRVEYTGIGWNRLEQAEMGWNRLE